MNGTSDLVGHSIQWAVGVQLLVLYCVSLGLFYAVDVCNRAASTPLKKETVLNASLLFCAAAASNALAVLTFVFISKKIDVVPRLAMIGVPLFLIIEKHVRAARANPENRRIELILASGVTAGIVGGAVALMRGCPLK